MPHITMRRDTSLSQGTISNNRHNISLISTSHSDNNTTHHNSINRTQHRRYNYQRTNRRIQPETQLSTFFKLAKSGHFGCPKFIFGHISRHFRSKHNFHFFFQNGRRCPFWISKINLINFILSFFSKWPPHTRTYAHTHT
jgi:hypothetical protein